MKHDDSGFSVLEMMVALACIAVLLTLATPSFQRFWWARQVDARLVDLVSTLRFARAQAMNVGSGVTVCPLSMPVEVDAAVTASAGSGLACAQSQTTTAWSKGWMVFADRNFNGRFETEDSLLRLEQGTAGSSTSINATASRISIQPLGIIEYPHAGSSFEVFPTSSSASHVSEPSALSRHICLSKPGRIRLTEFGQGC